MTLLLTKPTDKNWGIAIKNNQDLANRVKACLKYTEHPGDFTEPLWASYLRGCRPFIQCDTETHLFIEFWTENSDIILKCVELLGQYLQVEVYID